MPAGGSTTRKRQRRLGIKPPPPPTPTVVAKPGVNVPVGASPARIHRQVTQKTAPRGPVRFPSGGTQPRTHRDVSIIRAERRRFLDQLDMIRHAPAPGTAGPSEFSRGEALRILTRPNYALRKLRQDYTFSLDSPKTAHRLTVPLLFHAALPAESRALEQQNVLARKRVSGEAVAGQLPAPLHAVGQIELAAARTAKYALSRPPDRPFLGSLAEGAKRGAAGASLIAAPEAVAPKVAAVRLPAGGLARLGERLGAARTTTAAVARAPGPAIALAGRRLPSAAAAFAIRVPARAFKFGPAAAVAPELVPGGSPTKALTGQGRFASILPNKKFHGPLGVALNAVEDAVNLPANTLPMVYIPAAALVAKQNGNDVPFNNLITELKKNDMLGNLSHLDFAGVARAFQEHPLYSMLEVAGVYAGLGRGLGASLRAVNPKLAPTHLGSRAGIPIGEHQVYERGYSPNVITALAQKLRDFRTPPAEQRKFAIGPGGGRFGFGPVKGRTLEARAVNTLAGRAGTIEQLMNDTINALAKHIDIGKATPVVRWAVQGQIARDTLGPDLAREIARIEGTLPGLPAHRRRVAQVNLDALKLVAKDPAKYADKLFRAADAYHVMWGPLEEKSIEYGFGNRAQFERAAAVPAQVSRGLATHVTPAEMKERGAQTVGAARDEVKAVQVRVRNAERAYQVARANARVGKERAKRLGRLNRRPPKGWKEVERNGQRVATLTPQQGDRLIRALDEPRVAREHLDEVRGDLKAAVADLKQVTRAVPRRGRMEGLVPREPALPPQPETRGVEHVTGVMGTPGMTQRGIISGGKLYTWDAWRGIHADMDLVLSNRRMRGEEPYPGTEATRADLDIGKNGDVSVRVGAQSAKTMTDAERQDVERILAEQAPNLHVVSIHPAEAFPPGRPLELRNEVEQSWHDSPTAARPAAQAAEYGHAQALAGLMERLGQRKAPPGTIGGMRPDEVHPYENGSGNIDAFVDAHTKGVGVDFVATEGVVPPLAVGGAEAAGRAITIKEIRAQLAELGVNPVYMSEVNYAESGLRSPVGSFPTRVAEGKTGQTALEGAAPSELRDILDIPQRRIRALTQYQMISDAIEATARGRFATKAEALHDAPEGWRPVNVDPWERRGVIEDGISHGDPGAWDPEAIEMLTREGPEVFGEAQADVPGTWRLMRNETVKLLQDHVSADTGFPGPTWRAANAAFKRVVLTTSPSWYSGNAMNVSMIALLNRLAPPPFGFAGERIGIGAGAKGRTVAEALGPEDAATLLPGGLTDASRGLQRRLRVPLSERENISVFIRDLAKFGRAPGVKGLMGLFERYANGMMGLNAKIVEEPIFTQMLGKVAARDIRSQLPVWRRAFAVNKAALRDFAAGKHSTANQMALADIINKEVGNWSSMAPWEKQLKTNYVPFWMWYRAATRFVLLTLPHEHPVFTSLIAASAAMTQEERQKLGLDLIRGQGGTPDYLQGGLPAEGGLRQTAHLTALGLFNDYPGMIAQAVVPPIQGPLHAFANVDWKNDAYQTVDGRGLNELQRAVLGTYLMLEAYIPFATIGSKVIARGRKTVIPFVKYQGDKQFTTKQALTKALIPSPLPGSRSYKPPGSGGSSGTTAPSPGYGSDGGGGGNYGEGGGAGGNYGEGTGG